jgi:NADH-quinone oxidoreductase subunit A
MLLTNLKQEYLHLIVFIVLSLILSIFLLLLSYSISYKKKNDIEKLSAYECGFDPFGSGVSSFEVHFYIVGILFIIFDLEIIFLYPWAVKFKVLGGSGFYVIIIFLLILTVGFVYEWQKGALDWTKSAVIEKVLDKKPRLLGVTAEVTPPPAKCRYDGIAPSALPSPDVATTKENVGAAHSDRCFWADPDSNGYDPDFCEEGCNATWYERCCYCDQLDECECLPGVFEKFWSTIKIPFMLGLVIVSFIHFQSDTFYSIVNIVKTVFYFPEVVFRILSAANEFIFSWGIELNFGFFLMFSGLIFSIGAFGIAFNRKNVLLLMASVEIMFLGVNLVFISGYIFLNLEVGLIYALINLSISAAEAAIGFGLLMSSFRNRPDISFGGFNSLRG